MEIEDPRNFNTFQLYCTLSYSIYLVFIFQIEMTVTKYPFEIVGLGFKNKVSDTERNSNGCEIAGDVLRVLFDILNLYHLIKTVDKYLRRLLK